MRLVGRRHKTHHANCSDVKAGQSEVGGQAKTLMPHPGRKSRPRRAIPCLGPAAPREEAAPDFLRNSTLKPGAAQDVVLRALASMLTIITWLRVSKSFVCTSWQQLAASLHLWPGVPYQTRRMREEEMRRV